MKEGIIEIMKWGLLVALTVGYFQSNIRQNHFEDRLNSYEDSYIKGWGN